MGKCIMHFSGNPNQCANFGGVFLHLLTNTRKDIRIESALPRHNPKKTKDKRFVRLHHFFTLSGAPN